MKGLLKDFLKYLENDGEIADDSDFNFEKWARNTVRNDSKKYSRILSSYESHIAKTLKFKRTYKHFVFWVSLSMLTITFVAFFCVLLFDKNAFDDLSFTVSSLISLVTVFIVIPQIISNYLFNKDEEKYMCEIVKNIQKHDLSILDPSLMNDDNS